MPVRVNLCNVIYSSFRKPINKNPFVPSSQTHFVVDAGVAERPSDTLDSMEGADALREAAAFHRCSGSTMSRGMNLLKMDLRHLTLQGDTAP